MENLKEIVVIYHAHCQDGFGSAFAAYKKFGDEATYIAARDRKVPPEGLANKEVYIVDFSYPKEVLVSLQENNKKVVMIDHHISAQEDIKVLNEHVFSLEHSGAYLSWVYFVSEEVPEFIKTLEMIDLAKDQKNEHGDTITYVLSKPFTFEAYETLLREFSDQDSLAKIKQLGQAQNDYLEIIVESLIDEPDFVEFEGYTVPCINIALPINEKSIVLSRLYTKYPPFAMSYRFDNGLVKVSLRGRDLVDLNALASKYGGGGHKNAAGFVVPADIPLPFAKKVIV
jgi:oligoribonuclease NrnB/cAMP/cGMP phosphodiesterase (DHH superfamily)